MFCGLVLARNLPCAGRPLAMYTCCVRAHTFERLCNRRRPESILAWAWIDRGLRLVLSIHVQCGNHDLTISYLSPCSDLPRVLLVCFAFGTRNTDREVKCTPAALSGLDSYVEVFTVYPVLTMHII